VAAEDDRLPEVGDVLDQPVPVPLERSRRTDLERSLQRDPIVGSPGS